MYSIMKVKTKGRMVFWFIFYSLKNSINCNHSQSNTFLKNKEKVCLQKYVIIKTSITVKLIQSCEKNLKCWFVSIVVNLMMNSNAAEFLCYLFEEKNKKNE